MEEGSLELQAEEGDGDTLEIGEDGERRESTSSYSRRESGSSASRRESGSSAGRRESGSSSGRRESGSGSSRRESGFSVGRRESGPSGERHMSLSMHGCPSSTGEQQMDEREEMDETSRDDVMLFDSARIGSIATGDKCDASDTLKDYCNISGVGRRGSDMNLERRESSGASDRRESGASAMSLDDRRSSEDVDRRDKLTTSKQVKEVKRGDRLDLYDYSDEVASGDGDDNKGGRASCSEVPFVETLNELLLHLPLLHASNTEAKNVYLAVIAKVNGFNKYCIL